MTENIVVLKTYIDSLFTVKKIKSALSNYELLKKDMLEYSYADFLSIYAWCTYRVEDVDYAINYCKHRLKNLERN